MNTEYLLIIQLLPWVGFLLTGLFGLIIGSFISFLFYRIRAGEPWLYGKGAWRSKCPSCRHILGARDLIPVISWVMSKGQCSYCKIPISIRYPLIEIATAIMFMAAWFLLTQ